MKKTLQGNAISREESPSIKFEIQGCIVIKEIMPLMEPYIANQSDSGFV